MKTIRSVYDDICSFENLYRAFQKAQRGKRYLGYTVQFDRRLEENLLELSRELQDQSYFPGDYRTFWIQEPKPRLISAAPFRDRIVHHALIDIIEPLIDSSFVEDSFACRKGKGTHAAINRSQYFLKRFPWVLKCDIRKYFPSIDHYVLFNQIKRKIRDRETLWLISLILRTSNAQEPVPIWFSGDDLLTPVERRKGLPIGNLTSQFFANFYLNGMDHFIKHELRCKGYVRYMDDFILFGDSKERMQDWKVKIRDHLEDLRLKLHPRKQEILPSKNGIYFLGFAIYSDRRRLSKKNIYSFLQRIEKQVCDIASGQLLLSDFRNSLVAWIGHASHGNTWNLRSQLFKGLKLKSKSA